MFFNVYIYSVSDKTSEKFLIEQKKILGHAVGTITLQINEVPVVFNLKIINYSELEIKVLNNIIFLVGCLKVGKRT